MSDSTEPTGSPGRMLLWAVAIFALLLAVLAVLAWRAGDVSLPMQYEGFD